MGSQVDGVSWMGGCALSATTPVARAGPACRSCRDPLPVDLEMSTDQPGGCTLASASLPELLTMLPELEAAVDAANARLRACVALLRERRASWREIGEVLEVSRQAAWQRFRDAESDEDQLKSS